MNTRALQGTTTPTFHDRAADEILRLQGELEACKTAIRIHMREESILDYGDPDGIGPVSEFLSRAAELESDLSVANMLWEVAENE